MKKLIIGTVFSGIGAPEYALKKMKIDYSIAFACDNGERNLKLSKEQIDLYIKKHPNVDIQEYIESLYANTKKPNNVKKSYYANYSNLLGDWYEDIRYLDATKYNKKIDIIIGGSPCQSFSISGYRAGLEDTRGTLFYEYARIVKEVMPKVFIYENVPGMLSHDKGNTFKIITEVFDSLGYNWKSQVLTATNFDIPQNRRRLFVVGIRKDLNVDTFEFPKGDFTNKVIDDFLESSVDHKYFHGEKGFKWVTSEKSLKKRVSINSKIARTQTANQQFNWCGNMIFYPISEQKWAKKDERVYIGTYKGEKGVIRKLTPRECLRLMGYDDKFNIVVPDNVMYRQCGNSIVVNVLESIFESIFKTEVLKK